MQGAWEHVGYLYGCIVSLFGAPFAIAERLAFVRKNRRDLLAWLGPVEALARRLLLLKALSLPKSNQPPPASRAGRVLIAFTDRPIPDIHPDSEQWRVRFNVMPRGLRSLPHNTSPCNDRRGDNIFNALPLARRLEALRRVLEQPGPAIARLCRLLASARETVISAFRPYRPPATCVRDVLDSTQRELTRALDTG